MTASVTRPLEITYAGVTLGGTTDRYIDGWSVNEVSFERARFQCEFWIRNDTEADFVSEVATVEAAFRKPRQSLTVTINGTSLFSMNHSGSTGFDSEPTLTKVEGVGNSRSRKYRLSVEFGLPADNVTTNGRRSSTVSVAYDESRIRTVTISVVYTAITSTTARAQYEAQMGTYVTSALAVIDSDATFELIGEPLTEANDTNKVINCTRVYREIIFNQNSGVLNDTGVVNPTLVITRDEGDTGNIQTSLNFGGTLKEMVKLTATFSCGIDQDVTTDLTGKWPTLKNYIINQIATVMAGGSLAITRIAPSFDFYGNRISAVIEGIGAETMTVKSSLTIRDYNILGKVLVPALTGKPYSKYVYQGPAQRIRTVTVTVTDRVTFNQSRHRDGGPSRIGTTDERFIQVSHDRTTKPTTFGIPPNTIDTVEKTDIYVYEFHEPIEGIIETGGPPGGELDDGHTRIVEQYGEAGGGGGGDSPLGLFFPAGGGVIDYRD